MPKLLKRTLTGLAFLSLLAVAMLHEVCFVVIMGGFMLVMFEEYYRMALAEERSHYMKETLMAELIGLSILAILFIIKEFNVDSSVILLIFVPLIAFYILLLFNGREREGGRMGGDILFPVIYVALPLASSVLLVFDKSGNFSVHYFVVSLLLICMSDVGAYVCGMSLGQKPDSRKLCPSVSPKKSWAGVWGAVVFVTLSSIAVYFTGFETNVLLLAAISLIVIVFGILGDLFESLIKRHYGKKDSGSILPGHGGMMDRLDGALFVIPVVVVFLKIMLII